MTQSKPAASVIVAILFSILAVAALAPRSPGQVAEVPGREEPPDAVLSLDPKLLEERAGDDELRRLSIERYRAAADELRYAQSMAEVGIGSAEAVISAGRRAGLAALALTSSKTEQIRIRENLLKLAERLEADQKLRIDVGRGNAIDLHRARYARIEAQIDLLLAKRAAGR